MINRISAIAVLALAFACSSCARKNDYEVIERREKEVPNFQGRGTHTEVDYVLLHEGHRIYATCDVADIDKLDPTATCGFRPLHSYECTLQSDSMEKATLPMSDLKCRDADGHPVYLYVNKME
jgi:hypothetical protein